MQTLDLNLASRPFRNNVLLWSGHSAAAALLLGFTIWNVHAYFDYGERLDNLRQSVDTIDRQMERLELRSRRATDSAAKYDVKYLSLQSSRANEVIERRALSWTRLFNQLEKVQPYGVRMASIRPVYMGDADRRTGGKEDPSLQGSVPVSVEGTSQNLEQFLEFERALLGDPHFARVEPERSSLTRNASEVLFELRFLYYPDRRPDAPPEAAPKVGG
jgi:type IV pilus assembly protein PilN